MSETSYGKSRYLSVNWEFSKIIDHVIASVFISAIILMMIWTRKQG